jgi:HK97 family phage portal protein
MHNAANYLLVPAEEQKSGWFRRQYFRWGKKFNLIDPEYWKWKYGKSWQGGSVYSDVEETWLRLSAVWCCVRLITETIGSLPIAVYRRDSQGNKTKDQNHPVAKLLRAPNELMTPVEFFEAMQMRLVTCGNSYAEITRSVVSGEPISLTPLRSQQVSRVRKDGVRFYRYSYDGKVREIREENMFHLRGFGDGELGLSPIGYAQEQLGLAKAQESYGSKFFENSARPGGYLKVPQFLNPAQRTQMLDVFNNLHQGEPHKLGLLEGGIDYVAAGIPPDEAQFIESRKFSVVEICRIFRTPPHMVFELDRATFSNIENQGIEFTMYTLRPYLTRWEQRINKKLFEAGSDHFAEFNLDGLLRGDSAARTAYYSAALQNGWMNRNEVRAKENMNRIEGGEEYTVQVNLTPLDQLGVPAAPVPAPAARRELLEEALKVLSWKMQPPPQPIEMRQPLNIHLSHPVTMPEQKPVQVDVRVEGAKTDVTLITPPKRAVLTEIISRDPQTLLAKQSIQREIDEEEANALKGNGAHPPEGN